MVRIVAATDSAIEEAAAIIRAGGLVVFPTETVYGLGANALDGQAVARIFAAKGRPSFNPLISHFASARNVAPYAVMDARAEILAQTFWPGPLTLVLNKKTDCAVSELASAGLPTLAVRVPAHPVARRLLEAAGVPVAAPSANISGSISPTAPAHISAGLGEHVQMLLAAGMSEVGLESTVVDLTGPLPLILRPGAVTQEDLERTLGESVAFDLGGHKDKPRSPGQLLRHYAPDTPVRLNAIDLEPGEALLAFGSARFMGIRGGGSASGLPEGMHQNLSEDGDLYEAAANLFAMLRALDRPEHKHIAVMAIPEKGIGVAINDRLRRAAAAHAS